MEAVLRLLSGLVDGQDVFEIAAAVAGLHPKNDTFPGEVYMTLASDALALAGVDRDDPMRIEVWSRTTCLSQTFVVGMIERSSMRFCPVVRYAAVSSLTH